MIQNPAIYEQASDLLLALWRAVDPDFKERYKADIWRIYEDRVRAAAGQNGTLARFVSQLARSLGGSLGRNETARGIVADIVASGDDHELLRLLREETPYLILLVRLAMKDLKEQWNDEQL